MRLFWGRSASLNCKRTLSRFWPKNGPCWDALARVKGKDGSSGVLLVEAKSHVGEMQSTCKAEDPVSLSLIERSLNEVRMALGVPSGRDWAHPFYQYANRLAHLYFFRVRHHLPAWLVNVYFVGDKEQHGPESEEAWRVEIERAKHVLGIHQDAHKLASYTADVFPVLPAVVSTSIIPQLIHTSGEDRSLLGMGIAAQMNNIAEDQARPSSVTKHVYPPKETGNMQRIPSGSPTKAKEAQVAYEFGQLKDFTERLIRQIPARHQSREVLAQLLRQTTSACENERAGAHGATESLHCLWRWNERLRGILIAAHALNSESEDLFAATAPGYRHLLWPEGGIGR